MTQLILSFEKQSEWLLKEIRMRLRKKITKLKKKRGEEHLLYYSYKQ